MKTLLSFALTVTTLAVGSVSYAGDSRVPSKTLDSLGLGGLTEMPEREASQVRGRWSGISSSTFSWNTFSSGTSVSASGTKAMDYVTIYFGEPFHP